MYTENEIEASSTQKNTNDLDESTKPEENNDGLRQPQKDTDTSINEDRESNTIYTAMYSGVKVIEMTIEGVAVMRRRNDSSFNATQILKIAGIDKAKRTKILEKEVHNGVYEKVQGGYGKFQGTWIPYDRAVALSQQYGVYDVLKPLFLFNISGSEANDTPTKEQAIAAQRKNSNATPGNSFYKSMSRQPSTLGRTFSTLTDADETEIIAEKEGSPTKKPKVETTTKDSSSNIELFEHDLNIDNPNTPFTLEPLSNYLPEHEHSKEVITQIFLSQDFNNLSDLIGETPSDDLNLDVPIDELGHTALHWASALARIPLVKELIKRGSIRIRGNNNGESPLIRAVLVTNNYDQGTFNELLNLLYPCISLLDHQRRSVLHHISLTAGIKKRSSASRYYLETLLEWIVKTGSYLSKGSITLGRFMNEIVNAQDKNGDTCLNISARIGNKAIVQQLLDVGADPSIPNKAGLRPMDFGINVNGLSINVNPSLSNGSVVNGNQKSKERSYSNGNSTQSSSKILESMQQVLIRLDSDFKQEISVKQNQIDQLHAKLRDSTIKLSKNRKNLEFLTTSELKVNELKQKITNVDKAIIEEEQNFIDQTTELGSIGNYDVDFDADEPFRIPSIYDEFNHILTTDKTIEIEDLKLNKNIDSSDLPPSVVLKARIKAYKENSKSLEGVLTRLNENSATLEAKFRRVVALCTGVEESKIGQILDGLVQAVESDPDEVDMGRVVGFLKKIDDKE